MLSNTLTRVTIAMGIVVVAASTAFPANAQSERVDEEIFDEAAQDHPEFAESYRRAAALLYEFNGPDSPITAIAERWALEQRLSAIDLCELLPPRQPHLCPDCDSACGPVLEGEEPENPITCADCMVERRECENKRVLGCVEEQFAIASSSRVNESLRKSWPMVVQKYPRLARSYADTIRSVIRFSGLVNSRSARLHRLLSELNVDFCSVGALPTLSELEAECTECRSSAFDLDNPTEFQAYLRCQGERAACLREANAQLHCPG